MNEGLLTLGAAAGALIAILVLAGMGWRGFSYLVRTHDELLGKEGQGSVRDAVEKLDCDLREHMKLESSTISKLQADLEGHEAREESKFAHMAKRIEELYDLVLRK